MVQHFNFHGNAPGQIDILRTIYLIANAADSLTTQTIVNCWAKAYIRGDEIRTRQEVQQGKDELNTSIALQRALDVLNDASGTRKCSIKHLRNLSSIDESKSERDLPNVVALVVSGILNGSPAELELSDTDTNGDEEEKALEVPMITSDTAIHSYSLSPIIEG